MAGAVARGALGPLRGYLNMTRAPSRIRPACGGLTRGHRRRSRTSWARAPGEPHPRYPERTRCLTRIRSETARQLYPNELTSQAICMFVRVGHCTKSLRSSPLRGGVSRQAGADRKDSDGRVGR
jgi:hypothetical protein